jgi:hypothetical protein
MSAPMAPPAYAPPGSANTAVIRSVGRCFACLFFSGGLWAFAWIYHTTREVTPRVRQPPPQSPGARAALYLIPIYNLVLHYQIWEEVNDYCRRARAQEFNVLAMFLLSFIVPFITYPIVQSRLNDAHRAATNGAATNAPMETIDWVFVAIGIAFFVLYVILVIVIIVAVAASSS